MLGRCLCSLTSDRNLLISDVSYIFGLKCVLTFEEEYLSYIMHIMFLPGIKNIGQYVKFKCLFTHVHVFCGH